MNLKEFFYGVCVLIFLFSFVFAIVFWNLTVLVIGCLFILVPLSIQVFLSLKGKLEDSK